MAGFSKINHKGRVIIFLDYQGLTPDGIVEAMKEAESFVLKEQKRVLTLTNFTEAFATPKVMEQAKLLKAGIMHLTDRSAVYGLSIAKTVILKGFNKITKAKGIKPFSTREQALQYLTD
ncbi:MAG: hypothetical protein OCD76_01200 [Reichenbachiella sp.]